MQICVNGEDGGVHTVLLQDNQVNLSTEMAEADSHLSNASPDGCSLLFH